MSPEDRQAWLDMAGPDFLPWLQHEVGICLAKHGVRDGMADIKKQIEDLKAATESQSAAIGALAETAQALTALQSQMVKVLADLSGVVLKPAESDPLFKDVHGEPRQTAEEVATEEHEALEPLQQKLVDILDYIRANGRATQVELSYKLSISKTSVCERLGKLALLGLVAVSQERTHSSGTSLVYRLAGAQIPEAAPEVYVPKPGTRAAFIHEFIGSHPWLTVAEIHTRAPWVAGVPDRNVLCGTLNNEVTRGHYIKHSLPGDADRYALPGTPLPGSGVPTLVVKEAPEPVAPVAMLRPLTLHEQMTLNALKGQDYLNVAKICERITSISGATAQNSSIGSVCLRFWKSGRMERKLDDAGFWAFRIKP